MQSIFKWWSPLAFSFIWIIFESFVWGTFTQTFTYSAPSLCGSDLGAGYGLVRLSYYIPSYIIRLLASSNSFRRINIFALGLYKQDDHSEELQSFIGKLESIKGLSNAPLWKLCKSNTTNGYRWFISKVFSKDHSTWMIDSACDTSRGITPSFVMSIFSIINNPFLFLHF